MASSRINERQLSELFGLLRSVRDWGDLEQRLAVAIRRNASATAARDGSSGVSSGFAAGGGSGEVHDPTSATGAARAEWGERRDPLHEHTRARLSEPWSRAVTSVQVLRSRLDAIDHLSDVWEPVHRTGDLCSLSRPPTSSARPASCPPRDQARAHAEGRRIRVKA